MTTPPARPPAGSGRANQKKRTRDAIVRAASELSRTGRDVTMPEIAKAALVSEATAYRYFPDLASLLQEAIADQLPDLARALAGATDSADPVDRVAAAANYLLRHVLTREGVVRAMIAATVIRPERAPARPGLRIGLIDHALEPLQQSLGATDPAALIRLKLGLSTIVSAEALFSLTDLHGLDPEAAISVIVHTATALTRTAIAESERSVSDLGG
jgi:AcrR family transcriptional regulator